jgi:PAS domain S-box-containing protein
MLGYRSPEDLLGKDMHELLHHTCSDGSPLPKEKCGLFHVLKNGERCHHDDEIFWRVDGTSFAAEAWSAPIFHDGILVGAVVTFIDVTERNALRSALAKNEEYLRSLVNCAGDAIYVCDETGRLQDCNLRACEILGYSREELLSMSVADVDAQMTEEMNAKLWEELEPGRVYTVESQHLRRDGTIYPVEIRIGLLGAGDPKLILGLARDITNRKKVEEEVRLLNVQLEQRISERTAALEASNKELESFCYSVSHDLRAPLRAMSSFSSILSEEYADRLDQQGENYLSRISGGAQRMGQLIDDLLQLGRVGRADLTIEDLDLTAMADDVAAQLADSQSDRQVGVVVAAGLTARGDRLLMRLVLQNLLDNAWKFTAKMPEGAVIEVGCIQRDGNNVYFVRDNGAGFDMAYSDKLFAAFQRLHNDESFKGTGVGLATVQRIIERHGGRIWAESEPEKGSTFFFTL